jgi:hypothetical protein
VVYTRTRGGLKAVPCCQNVDKLKDPSLKWVDNPNKGDLLEKRKADLIKEL